MPPVPPEPVRRPEGVRTADGSRVARAARWTRVGGTGIRGGRGIPRPGAQRGARAGAGSRTRRGVLVICHGSMVTGAAP
ncbi:hypothetical protein GCM10010330_03260 [Streptomyces tendae]|nr:hypothetical protein GCM10010330_03260 [Streptomyces tendae]